MKSFLKAALQPSNRKLIAFLLGFLVLTFNDPFRLKLDASEQALLITYISGYIGQSTYKELKGKAQTVSA